MTREPIILPPPTDDELRSMVDRLITPETADKDARAFIRILQLTGDEMDGHKANTAQFMARYAFSKTQVCEEALETAYHDWIGFRMSPPRAVSEPEMREIGHIG